MVKRASDGMIIRYGEGGAKLEGKELTKYMTQLNDYLGFFEKVQKRLRNEEVTLAFAELFANEGKDSARRVDFETPAKLQAMRQRLNAMQKTYQFKNVGDVAFDEEHRSYSVSYTDAQGAVRNIDWALASAPESRQMLAKQAQLKDQLSRAVPHRVRHEDKSRGCRRRGRGDRLRGRRCRRRNRARHGRPKPSQPSAPPRPPRIPSRRRPPREVFNYVIEQGKKEYQVQRYKGLGEMTSSQLWETTMDPERRTLLQVKLEDIAASEEIFTTLMGEDVEAAASSSRKTRST